MYDVYVLNAEDAKIMYKLGFQLFDKREDVNGKIVWHFIQPDKAFSFEADRLPQSAIVKSGVHINFAGRRKCDG